MKNYTGYFLEECIRGNETGMRSVLIARTGHWKKSLLAVKTMSKIFPKIVFRFNGTDFNPYLDKYDFYYFNGKRISREHAADIVMNVYPQDYNYKVKQGSFSLGRYMTIRGALYAVRYGSVPFDNKNPENNPTTKERTIWDRNDNLIYKSVSGKISDLKLE